MNEAVLEASRVQEYIAQGIRCSHLAVEGDGRHFYAVIVSDAFEGLKPAQRHRRVYQVLGDRMKDEIHALSMQTYTPQEWAAREH